MFSAAAQWKVWGMSENNLNQFCQFNHRILATFNYMPCLLWSETIQMPSASSPPFFFPHPSASRHLSLIKKKWSQKTLAIFLVGKASNYGLSETHFSVLSISWRFWFFFCFFAHSWGRRCWQPFCSLHLHLEMWENPYTSGPITSKKTVPGIIVARGAASVWRMLYTINVIELHITNNNLDIIRLALFRRYSLI